MRKTAIRTFAQRVTIIAIALSLAMAFSTVVPGPVYAQEAPGLSGLLKKLFRGGQRGEAREKNLGRDGRKTARGNSSGVSKKRRIGTVPQTETVVPEKLENARVVLVIGDFMALGLADGLEIAFQTSPGVVIVDAANGSSGLVRDDYYNWNASSLELIDAHKPSVAVIMIGANDRQEMVVADSRESVGTPKWTAQYKERAKALAGHFAKSNIPVVWVGMVPFKSPRATSDILAFNDIYREAAEAANGEFVDAWNGFVDENGNFISRGPDINGQIVRLRASDGINITKAARRLLAFFAEKPLRKMLGGATAPDIAILGPENLPELNLDPLSRATDITRTQPMKLDELDSGGELTLLDGEAGPQSLGPRSVGENLVVEGLAPVPPPGRVDNFMINQAGIEQPGTVTRPALPNQEN